MFGIIDNCLDKIEIQVNADLFRLIVGRRRYREASRTIVARADGNWLRCRLRGHGMQIKVDPKKNPEFYCTRLATGKRSNHLLVSHPEVMKRLLAWAKAFLNITPVLLNASLYPARSV